MSVKNPTLAHFRHFSSLLTHFPSTIVENSLQITPFYAKQTQFYSFFSPQTPISRKNKANSNPIQSQFNPKQTQFKPISKPNKPNWTPHREGDRMKIRYLMSETTYLWQLQFKTVFYIIIVLLDDKTLKS